MSSEESGEEDTIIIHALPWRSKIVNDTFARIDSYNNSKKSPQARRQMKERVGDSPSERPVPDEDSLKWAVQAL